MKHLWTDAQPHNPPSFVYLTRKDGGRNEGSPHRFTVVAKALSAEVIIGFVLGLVTAALVGTVFVVLAGIQ